MAVGSDGGVGARTGAAARLLAAALLLPVAGAAAGAAATGRDARAVRGDVVAAATAGGMSGAVGVLVDGRVLVADVGPAARGGGRAGGGERWRWASVTKQVVAVAVLRQVERGRLALDAPLARFWPGSGVAGAERVTVRMLLQHRSGLPNPEDGPTRADGSLRQYSRSEPQPPPGLAAVCRGPAKAAPGARFEYNNCDYEVLGALLERVTGRPLAAVLRADVFARAGMARTRLLKPGGDAGRPGFSATGAADDDIDPGRFGAAAGLAGPVEDLAAFDRALMGDRLLAPATRAEMERGDPGLGFAGLGVWAYSVPVKGCAGPVRIVERRGEVGGVQVRNLMLPERGIAVIAFADRPVVFGEPWMGTGLTLQLVRAAACGTGA